MVSSKLVVQRFTDGEFGIASAQPNCLALPR